jgi:hypothetical protein
VGMLPRIRMRREERMNCWGKVSLIVRNGKRVESDKAAGLPAQVMAALLRRSPMSVRIVVGIHAVLQTLS